MRKRIIERNSFGMMEMVRIAEKGNSSTINITVELFPIYAIPTKNGK